MNRDLAELIKTHGDEIWPFIKLLSKFELESCGQSHITIPHRDADLEYLIQCQEFGLLKIEDRPNGIKVFFEEDNWPLYKRKPEPAKIYTGATSRFSGLTIWKLQAVLNPEEEVGDRGMELNFALANLRKRYSDDQILRVAEENAGKIKLNLFVTKKVFAALLTKSQKAKESISHRGEREYTEWS